MEFDSTITATRKKVIMKIFSSLLIAIFSYFSLSAQRIPDPKPVIVKITSTMCNVCGLVAWDDFKDIAEKYKEEAVVMAIHPLEISDLYSETALEYAENLPSFFGTPMLYTNDEYAEFSFHQQANDYVTAFKKRQVVAHPFINYKIEENELVVKVKTVFLKNNNRPHYFSLFVVEDEVIAPQDSRGPEDKHTKVLRTHFGESTFGELFSEEPITVNQEFEKTYRMPIDVSWNKENLEIAAIIWEKNGEEYRFVNANAAVEPVFTTSTNEIVLEPIMTVQPNPFSAQTTIRFELKNEFVAANLQVMDVTGNVIAIYPISEQRGSIEIGKKLTKGIYFAQIRTEAEVGKILKIIAL